MFHPRDLDVFCKVADTGNMTRVAESEHKTVMAISKQIAKLEQQLSQPLFERTKRALVLTEFGEAFREHAQPLVEQHRLLDAWSESTEAEITGEVRVLVQSNDMISETLAPWMDEFLRQYPKLTIALDVKESLIDITEDDYDVFWGIGAYLGDKFQGLKRRNLWQERYGVFASPAYLDEKGRPASIDDVDHLDVIGYLYNQPANILVFQNEQGEMTYKTPNCRVKTVAGILELAEKGLGLINAPARANAVQRALTAGTLEPVLEDHWWQDAEAFVYYHQTSIPQPKVRAFIDFFYARRNDWEEL